jgi:hypothetical protein
VKVIEARGVAEKVGTLCTACMKQRQQQHKQKEQSGPSWQPRRVVEEEKEVGVENGLRRSENTEV